MKIVKVSKEYLFKLYRIDKKGTGEIARILNCSKNTVRTKLKKFEIPRWSQSVINKRNWSGRIVGKETKKKMSLAQKIRGGGWKWTQEAKYKLSRANSGKKSHRWKGGITLQSKLQRTKFHATIHKQVLLRDNYICQLCEKRGGKLHVDHIQPWSEYPDLRFYIDNCRTLCMECHYKLTFGKTVPINLKTWGYNLSQMGINQNTKPQETL